MIKVIAFDVFGTVFDLSQVQKNEIKEYIRHIKQDEWQPLTLPKSWEDLQAHPDATEGLTRLRSKYMVVTCSNGPLGLLAKMSKNNRIEWDAIIPLELNKVYKTNPAAYMTVCEVLDVKPSEVMMVTSNKDFGDLEVSASLGMKPQLVDRHEGTSPTTIVELAELLGC